MPSLANMFDVLEDMIKTITENLCEVFNAAQWINTKNENEVQHFATEIEVFGHEISANGPKEQRHTQEIRRYPESAKTCRLTFWQR